MKTKGECVKGQAARMSLRLVSLCRIVAVGTVLAIAAARDVPAQERTTTPATKGQLDVVRAKKTRPDVTYEKFVGAQRASPDPVAGDDEFAAAVRASLYPGASDKKLVMGVRAKSRVEGGVVFERKLRASESAVSQLRLDKDAILSGDVTAIVGGQAEMVTAGNVAEKADQNALFVARTGTDAKTITVPEALRASLSLDPAASAQQLSYEFTAPSAEAGAPLHLVALVLATSGLILDAAHAAFRGEFAVALSNSDKPSDMRAPDSPIGITVTAQGASIQPSPLTIPDVGRWHPVTLTVPVFSGPTYRIAVSTGTQDTGNAIDLAVTRPSVQLLPSSSSITGWGIGETRITIRVMGLSAPEGYGVTLSHDGGYLDPAFVKLDAQGVATTALRSDTAAHGVLSVVDAGLVSQPVTIQFENPWLFIIAAMVGGLAGAFLQGKGRRRWPYALAIGICAAIVMTVAYAVGIDWVSRVVQAPALAKSGIAVVFVLGAVAALTGVKALVPK